MIRMSCGCFFYYGRERKERGMLVDRCLKHGFLWMMMVDIYLSTYMLCFDSILGA